MDLRLKGKTWVGNIYQKFEAVCQEVDDFVSKDTVKYVESQVQTVGGRVKKFCSDVVLPYALADSVKHVAETVPQKSNDAMETCDNSTNNIEENYVDINTEHSSVEQDPVDHPSPELNHEKQIMPMPSEDFYKMKESFLPLKQDDFSLSYDNAGTSPEGNHCSEFEEIAMKEQSLAEDLSSPGNEILGKVSSANVIDGVRSSPSLNERTICETCFDDCHSCFSSTSKSSKLKFSFVSCGSEVADTTLISSRSSLSTESYILSDYYSHPTPQETEKMLYERTDAVTCDSLSAFESLPNTACGDTSVDTQLALSNSLLSLESTNVDSSRIDDAGSADGSSGYKHGLHCKCYPLEDLMSSLEIGDVDDSNIDTVDPNMETINLSDEARLDESCDFVDNKLLCAVSCRAIRHRSYKKLIQDAIRSRKRLRKEYEQLGILYGDIDMDTVLHQKQNMSPCIADVSLESKHSTAEGLSDSEWEIL